MMMDTTVDTDGTAFICPECSFNGKSLPELISHLNEVHSEETANKSEAPPKNASTVIQSEKRSRRKPAFSHQIISQAPRQSTTLFAQKFPLNTESDSNKTWSNSLTSDKNGTGFISSVTDDSSVSMVSDENANISFSNKNSSNSTVTGIGTAAAIRNPNVLHSILSQQRPIAPKNGSPTTTKITPASSPLSVPIMNCSSATDNSFYSNSTYALQPYRKNFQCRMCRLTYKNFHDCTAHIRKKHEISHAQAGRFVEKLDTDAPLPPSATGNYKFRIKGKSLPPQSQQLTQQTNFPSAIKRTSLTPISNDDLIKTYKCKYCSFSSHWPKDIAKHQRTTHPNYPPHILHDEYVKQDNEINNNINNDDDDEGLSEFLIDPVRAFGEVIDSVNDNMNDDDYEEYESQEEDMFIEENFNMDDDEDEALWKYQQEINHLSESDMAAINNSNNSNSNYSLMRCFKKFRCPHCEHSAPTLAKLRHHLSTHVNIKPFMCAICGWRANLRWYIQFHAKKRHPNMNVEILQLSQEEAEQTIDAYMKERGFETKLNGFTDSKCHYLCSLCQYSSSDAKFVEKHIATGHSNKPYAKVLINRKQHRPHSSNQSVEQSNRQNSANEHDDKIYSKFMIKPTLKLNGDYHDQQTKSQALYNRSSLIQSDGSILLPDPSKIVYPNFSSHPNFNPNRLFYCALCYRGYRWRYDVKRHHKTMHETPEDEAAMGLSMSPKSVKRRNKEFNRNFRYLEYVPQLDGLISASMSSVHNHLSLKQEHSLETGNTNETVTDDDEIEESQDGLKISIADARTVDVTEDEAAALLMIEPQKSDNSSILVNDNPDDSVIIFEDDRQNLNESKEKSPPASADTSKTTPIRTSTGFKPYRCPYCFYRTNWRTDSLRHIRARHKIEPTQDGYYEMTPEEAERTYAEYERTFGFVVSKKVLGRFTDFRHIEWKDLQKSIWDKIKDKQGYEQIIYDRLKPDDDFHETAKMTSNILVQPVINKTPALKFKRKFACMECAFSSQKLIELDKHQCQRYEKAKQRKPHGKYLVGIYQCTKCSYKTIYKNYARKHVYLHRSKSKKFKRFYYCSFCGYNHYHRNLLAVHIAKHHPVRNTLTTIKSCRCNLNADFSIKHVHLRRSFVEYHLNNHKSNKSQTFYCIDCPHVSTSILEHEHHQSCHNTSMKKCFTCNHCSFSSDSLLYLHQHNLLHSKTSRLLSLQMDMKNLKNLAVSTIYKQTLDKARRYNCPFCRKFSSSTSSIVLSHIKNIHTANSNQFDDNLIIGSDMVKEILLLGKMRKDNETMEIN